MSKFELNREQFVIFHLFFIDSRYPQGKLVLWHSPKDFFIMVF